MDKVKEYLGILLGGRLVVQGNGRTFAKVPAWLVALLVLVELLMQGSIRLAVITVVLIVAFGMKVSITKA